jgi:hypothetical protein
MPTKLIGSVILLGGVFVTLVLLVIITGFPQPVLATGPTPTPVSQPDNLRCRLEQGADCEFVRPEDTAIDGTLIVKTNPLLEALEVPTKTLVSVTFGMPMMANTINDRTF